MDYTTQNQLLLDKLLEYYRRNKNLEFMLNIINGSSNISLRIVDWFVTNYCKKNYTVININNSRLKIYDDYKLKLKAYSKKRFDPFCRWERISIPFNNETHIQTTIGQLNFFKWALENGIIDYIQKNLKNIEMDMNTRNNSRSKENKKDLSKSRKKREELSESACRGIKRENVEVVISFN
mgnify:CR=1 FL=1